MSANVHRFFLGGAVVIQDISRGSESKRWGATHLFDIFSLQVMMILRCWLLAQDIAEKNTADVLQSCWYCFLGTGRGNQSPNYQLTCLFVCLLPWLFVCLFVSWLISTLWNPLVSLRLISWLVTVSSWNLKDHLQETVCLRSVTPNQPTNQPGKYWGPSNQMNSSCWRKTRTKHGTEKKNNGKAMKRSWKQNVEKTHGTYGTTMQKQT